MNGSGRRRSVSLIVNSGKPLSLELERERRAERSLLIIQHYTDGIVVAEIQAEFDCSRNTVLRYARAAGLDRRPKCFPSTIRNDVVKLLKEGKSYNEIRTKWKVSLAYISKVAKEEGLSRYGN